MGLALTLCGLAAAVARGDTYKLIDGATLEGELVAPNDKSVVVRLLDGSYSERVNWERFSQDDLKKLLKNPKCAKYVEPLVIEDEPSEAEKKRAAKPALVIKPVENRLERPAHPALLGGFFTSSVGWLVLLALYAANLWAAFEVAVFRAQPVGLVCGLAAVAPIVGQIVFLSMPTRLDKAGVLERAEGAAGEGAAEPQQKYGAHLKIAYATPETDVTVPGNAPPAIFKRGEFMFNRRFFESRFSNFFGMIRRDKDKAAVLVIKSSRGEFLAARITRIAASDMHIEIRKGSGTEEVAIPFVEIQEVQLKHGGAR
jgi:hypothetical protein